MKCINAILSIYIFSLAVLPCADESGRCIFDVEETFGTELHESSDHDHQNEGSNHCSPLCTCNCCHTTVKTPIKANLSITPPLLILSKYPLLASMLIDLTFINDIWQPPKLS